MVDIEIIAENKKWLVLNKPAGITVTTEGVNYGETVEKWLKSKYKWAKILTRGGLVHRLDKGTSGLLLVAKNEEVCRQMKDEFKQRRVEKRYMALVSGDLPRSGEIKLPIGRSKYSFGRWKVSETGKRAETKFEVIGKYRKDNKIYSLIGIHIMTGRTHQIRVHLSYMGWPLVGDKMYGGETKMIGRPFLHAYCMVINGIKHQSTLAPDLVETLNKYEKI